MLVKCLCYSHAIEVTKYDNEYSLTFWEPQDSKPWGRFRWAWYIIRNGYFNSQEILFDEEQMDKFVSSIESTRKITGLEGLFVALEED